MIGPVDVPAAIPPGSLVELWPKGTWPDPWADRFPFGSSDRPWSGRVRRVTPRAVILEAGDATTPATIVPWSRIAWVRIRGRPPP